jgi:predicted nucleotidyltransferase component of viral defense system
VDVLIDKRELLEKARARNLTHAMIEKDYVLGWLLFGMRRIRGLTFKGGTALSKIYFPQLWRLSEDLDFSYGGDFQKIASHLDEVFAHIAERSGIRFSLKSEFSNPGYLQLKTQYEGILSRNFIKVDVTHEIPIDTVASRSLSQAYSDYPSFKIRVQSIEEICAEKMRALIERKKSRDYYDVWKLMELRLNKAKLKKLFLEKCKYKGLVFQGLETIFPDELSGILEGYWQRELGRLIQPVPDLPVVIRGLRSHLQFMERM